MKKIILIIGFLGVFNAFVVKGQKHSQTSAHTSYKGLVMTGYQGWFGASGDGAGLGFKHYNASNGFQPGSASIEYWPDLREATPYELAATKFTFPDSSVASVFSSYASATVDRHFQWMEEYGIDGVFLQRFYSDFGAKSFLDKVMSNVKSAAEHHNRAMAIMYDLSGASALTAEAKQNVIDKVAGDWKSMIDSYGLTTSGDKQSYLYHNGKPLIAIWGLGFPDRHKRYNVDLWVKLVDFFQNDPVYGGCAVMIGVPTYWKDGGTDCITGPEHDKMLDLLKKCDIVMPWHTSRFNRDDFFSKFKPLIQKDIAWCNKESLDYTPTISPGIREIILNNNNYEKKRDGGYYFWDMARGAIEAGSQLLYYGMFDEMDEGTQFFKINNNPPMNTAAQPFATYEDKPEDHYLWLAGEVKRALEGEYVMATFYRQRADTSDFKTAIVLKKNGDVFELSAGSSVSGRKVYFADPYPVPDGAPTIGVPRNKSLFANELASSVASIGKEMSNNYIRFVEVDAATDLVYAYKTIHIGVEKVDDRHASAVYTGSWAQKDSANSFGHTITNSSNKDDKVTFTFTGQKVKFYGYRGANLGIADIYIDGKRMASTNCYYPSAIYNAQLYESPTLKDTLHTLEIQVTGSKHESSTGTMIVIDAFEYGPGNPPYKVITPTPSDGALLFNETTVALSWKSDASTQIHHVYVSTDSIITAEDLVSSQEGKSLTLDTLSDNGKYFWRVDTENSSGVAIGDVWSFSTKKAENVALLKQITSSSDYDSSYIASNANDGDHTSNESRWVSQSGAGFPQILEINLEYYYNIYGLRLYTGFDGYNRPINDFQLQMLKDTTWTDIIKVVANEEAIFSTLFESQKVHKIRLYITRSSGDLVRLYEIEVFGEYVSDCNNEVGGTAYFDDCGVCVGGSTGEEACSGITAIADFVKRGHKLYPNPAGNYIMIQGVSSNSKIEIYDPVGKKMSFGYKNGMVDIRNFHRGMYLIKVDNIYTMEFIKE